MVYGLKLCIVIYWRILIDIFVLMILFWLGGRWTEPDAPPTPTAPTTSATSAMPLPLQGSTGRGWPALLLAGVLPLGIAMQKSGLAQGIVAQGVAANMGHLDQSISRDNDVLNYSRINKITLQAWSPFQKGWFDGVFVGDRETLLQIARSCGIDPQVVADSLLGDGRAYVGAPGGGSGVPSFQFNQGMTVVGAQPASALLGAMSQALKDSERQIA